MVLKVGKIYELWKDDEMGR